VISIYQFDSYKTYVKGWVAQQPKQGHGEYRRMAMALNISTTMVSQIFNGDKDLSNELACELSEYLLHSDEESDYFLLLVQLNKSGSTKLKARLQRQVRERQERAKKLENRLRNSTQLGEQEKAVYYSNWIYPAIRLLCDLEEINSAEQIADRLAVPKNQIIKALEFLIQHGLVIQKGTRLSMGTRAVYLPPSDTLILKQHWNWRQVGLQRMPFSGDDQFFYSGQFSLSRQVAETIRRRLPDIITQINEEVKPSKSETIRCLNIDYFDI
jgi:plasmid maintenance system antidote protein VapI